MTRISLFLLLCLSLTISFSAQAGGKHWHKHKLQKSHQYHHNGGHYNFCQCRRKACKHHSHRPYQGQVQFFTLPQIAVGTRYGYSARGAVIVYRAYSLNGRP